MSTYLLSALCSFCYIFLKATQQINVVSGNYLRVLPVSVLMGLSEATILIFIVKANTVWIGAGNGVAAGAGATLAMWLHHRKRATKAPA